MGSPTRRDELDQFKTDINLCEYMLSWGFELDRKQSSRYSAILRHPSGEKLIVARGSNRHWKYFSVHDERDKGTIIDFVQLRDRCSLGEVRKTLRPWLAGEGLSITSTRGHPSLELSPTTHDMAQVLFTWENSHKINGRHDYLEHERQIPAEILSHPIFAGRIRTDRRGNALFAHYNIDGLCGFEIKNQGFTGFSTGGVKGLFCSRPRPDDRELILCETAIDALSYAALFGIERRRLVSTAGQVSPAQKRLIQSAAQKMSAGSTIVLAMDNDDAGHRLAETLHRMLSEVDLHDKTVVIRHPQQAGQDWNDVLRQSKIRPTVAFALC